MGTINQTEEDQANGVGKVFWDKVRRGRGKFYSYYRINYAMSTIIEDMAVSEQLQNQRRGGRAATASNPQLPATGEPFAPPPQMI